MTENNTICGYCEQIDFKICYPTYDMLDNKYQICQCNSCKAFFISPRPDAERLAQAYNSEYYGESSEKFEGIFEKFIDFFRKRRAFKLSRLINDKAIVLDIGCGNGKFLKNLLKYGNYKLYGIELEGNSAKRASQFPEINLKIGILEENDFLENSIDAITMFHVFEHLAEPKQTLNIINKILKTNGILVMSFPNISSFQAKIFKGKWLHLDPPRHLFYFEPKQLIKIMKENGFTYIKSYYDSIEQNPFGMTQSILNIFCKKREILFERIKGNRNYTKNFSSLTIFTHKLFFYFTFPLFIITNYIAAVFRKGATVEIYFKKISDSHL